MAEVSLALSYPEPLSSELRGLCRRSYFFTVECLIGKHKKPILFKHKHKVTEPSSVPYRAPPACANMEAYPDPPPDAPPAILVPESIAAQAAYQLRYKNTEYYS